MVGKWVQFDDETWHAIQAVARKTGKSFQELASTAFTNLLKEHNQPADFKAAVEASVTARGKAKKAPKRSKQKPRRRSD
jgi:protein-disulfide isomerase-like protein with CxxC motif